MNITFRYGDSTEREHIDAAQEASGAIVCTYPEVGKSQREQRAWTLGVCIAGKNVDILSSSDIILSQLRLCVAQNMLKPEDFHVIYHYGNGKTMQLKVYPSGAIEVWPRGFMDELENIQLDLIDAMGKEVKR